MFLFVSVRWSHSAAKVGPKFAAILLPQLPKGYTGLWLPFKGLTSDSWFIYELSVILKIKGLQNNRMRGRTAQSYVFSLSFKGNDVYFFLSYWTPNIIYPINIIIRGIITKDLFEYFPVLTSEYATCYERGIFVIFNIETNRLFRVRKNHELNCRSFYGTLVIDTFNLHSMYSPNNNGQKERQGSNYIVITESFRDN